MLYFRMILWDHVTPSEMMMSLNPRILARSNHVATNCRLLLLKNAVLRAFDVRPPDPKLKSSSFSGGNQQKLILARELDKSPSVLLVGQPTRGVDIGAIELIHQKIIDMRDANCAILLVSVELDEIMTLSDRILVMFEGRVVGSMKGSEADKTSLGLMMANAMPGAPNQTFKSDTGTDSGKNTESAA